MYTKKYYLFSQNITIKIIKKKRIWKRLFFPQWQSNKLGTTCEIKDDWWCNFGWWPNKRWIYEL